MLKKIKQERVEQQSSHLDYQKRKSKQQEGESKIDCTHKNQENCELKTNSNIYNLQYQRIMEQIKQIYQEQSTVQANKNNAKVEQVKLKKDKTVSKIISKSRKELIEQKSIDQIKINQKQEEQKDRFNKIQMHFTQITTSFLTKLKSEFEKVEMDLLALLNN